LALAVVVLGIKHADQLVVTQYFQQSLLLEAVEVVLVLAQDLYLVFQEVLVAVAELL
jgi:hypothetical protein